MIPVTFIGADGRATHAEGREGERLLDLAQAHGQPLEGTCGGVMACATCHVIVDREDFARLPPASLEEEVMLDFAEGLAATSRLSCQIILSQSLTQLRIIMPQN